MTRFRDRRRTERFVEYLTDLRDYCQGRIDSGDLDFDDWIYQTRDHAQAMLDIKTRLDGMGQ